VAQGRRPLLVQVDPTHQSYSSKHLQPDPRRLAQAGDALPQKHPYLGGKTRRIAHLLLLPICKVASTDVALVTNQLSDSTNTHTAKRPRWTCYHHYDRGRLAQLVRAPALQAGCRGFESLTAHHPSSHPPGQFSCCCRSREVWPEIVYGQPAMQTMRSFSCKQLCARAWAVIYRKL
jgi:hypothetical protein